MSAAADKARVLESDQAADVAKVNEKKWRRHLRATREGKAFIFVTIGVGVAAFNTGNNLLFLILGFMLSLIILSGVLSETAIRKIQLSRRIPRQCHAGQTCLVEVVLRNAKTRAPSYSLEVEDLAEGLPTERRCFFLKVAPSSEQVATYRRIPERRGKIQLKGFRVATRYPFGLFEKWRMVQCDDELVVYPALLPAERLQSQAFVQGQQTSSLRRGRGDELAELRAYRTGDEPRHIHWRRSAALGELVTIERCAETGANLTMILDNARPAEATAAWDDAFERAISRAATWGLDAIGRGQAVALLVRGQRSPRMEPGGDREPLLRFLSLLQSVSAEGAPAMAGVGRGEVPVPVAVMPEMATDSAVEASATI